MWPSDPTAGLAMITLSGIVVTDPQLHHTADGPVARFDVAAHERHLDPVTGQRVDTGTTWRQFSRARVATLNGPDRRTAR